MDDYVTERVEELHNLLQKDLFVLTMAAARLRGLEYGTRGLTGDYIGQTPKQIEGQKRSAETRRRNAARRIHQTVMRYARAAEHGTLPSG